MTFIQKLKTLFGWNKEKATTLQEEMECLKVLIAQSLQNSNTADGVKPDDVLLHTTKVKEIIVSLFEKGHLNIDRKTVDYILGNITSQENMIKTCYAGYAMGDVSIYNSQVGASLTEILKDIVTLVK